jgi:CNT family concentrative nucleoside transporter
MDILRGLLGLVIMIAILFAMSSDRKNIDWRLVASGTLLQLVLGVLVLKVDAATMVFDSVASFFIRVLDFTNAGINFLFTPFGDGLVHQALNSFVFKILPIIVFFSALSSVLYYFGILQLITRGIAWVMSKSMRLTGAESLAAAANIFIGQTEAPLVIKPYIKNMSRSEIMCLMCGGFATIAGSVFAAYVGFLGGEDPAMRQMFARHLLTASIMSAPAAIVAAKILLPESRKVSMEEQRLEVSKETLGSNMLDAIAIGSTEGLKLAINVGVMLLVFTAFIAMINFGMEEGIGSWTGLNEYVASSTNGRFQGFKLEYILGLIFSPVAWLLGVPAADTVAVGQLLGMKTAINEFYAYSQMPSLVGGLQTKSLIIATYALCGFANFASIGIQIGGISALAPNQRKTLTELGFKAMIGGTVACFSTAIIAGMLL